MNFLNGDIISVNKIYLIGRGEIYVFDFDNIWKRLNKKNNIYIKVFKGFGEVGLFIKSGCLIF